MMRETSTAASLSGATTARVPRPIVALDVPSLRDALALAEAIPAADFVKVGLQLFIAAGPAVVRELRSMERRVFLDLKLHDIPNTVAGAVSSAGELGVELLTVHASGGRAMLRAARRAAAGPGAPALLGVTVLTSLDGSALAEAWGREDLAMENGGPAPRHAMRGRGDRWRGRECRRSRGHPGQRG